MQIHHLAQSIPDELPAPVKMFFAWLVAAAIAVAAVPLIWNRILVPCFKWCSSMYRLRFEIENNKQTLDALRKEFNDYKAEKNWQRVRVNALMLTHHAAIFICDKSGSNLFVNQTYASMLQASKQELMGKNWQNFIAPADLRRYLRVSDTAHEDGQGYTEYLVMTNTLDEKIRVRVQTLILDEIDNEPVTYLGIITLAPLIP